MSTQVVDWSIPLDILVYPLINFFPVIIAPMPNCYLITDGNTRAIGYTLPGPFFGGQAQFGEQNFSVVDISQGVLWG
jgi:hypothetical protein